MGEWLLGVYKGRLITLSDKEKRSLWQYPQPYHFKVPEVAVEIFNKEVNERRDLRPYFYVLEPIREDKNTKEKGGPEIVFGEKRFLEDFGLSSIAYQKSGLPPIPAYGNVKKSCFLIDKKALAKSTGISVEMPSSGICVLALRSPDYLVRTGTFFKFNLANKGALVLEPCLREDKSLVGKGVLLGIRGNTTRSPGHMGQLDDDEAPEEMACPVTKVCVKFTHGGYGKREFYIAYREVYTDLRADMPLAFLKISRKKVLWFFDWSNDKVFEDMSNGLGESIMHVKEKFGIVYSYVAARNVLLDGTIVDYADIKDYIPRNAKEAALRKGETIQNIRGILFSAAVVSVLGKEAIGYMMRWEDGALNKIFRKNKKAVFEKYAAFFNKFREGAGEELSEYFKDLEKWDSG